MFLSFSSVYFGLPLFPLLTLTALPFTRLFPYSRFQPPFFLGSLLNFLPIAPLALLV